MLLFLAACGFVDTQTEFSPLDEAGPLTRVEIALMAGDVVVSGDPDVTGATGRFTATFSDTPPDVEHVVDDGVLRIEGACTALQPVCELDLALTVPAGVDLVVETGSGALTVGGTLGDVDAATGSGELCARGLGGYVRLETGSGDIVVEDVAGELVAETGSGDVEADAIVAERVRIATGSGDLSLGQAGPFTRVEVETGSGDIDVVVPAGAYALTTRSGSGDVDVDRAVVDDSAAEAALLAQTGSGDVTIGAR